MTIMITTRFDWMKNEPNDWHGQNCLTFLKDQVTENELKMNWEMQCDQRLKIHGVITNKERKTRGKILRS